jgi:hypothetical protein
MKHLLFILLFGAFLSTLVACQKESLTDMNPTPITKDTTTTVIITPVDTVVPPVANPLCNIPLGSLESLRAALQNELGELWGADDQTSNCGISPNALRMGEWYFFEVDNASFKERPDEFRVWLGHVQNACPTAPRLWAGSGDCDTTAKSIITIINHWTGDTVYVGRFCGGMAALTPGGPKVPINWTFTSFMPPTNLLAGVDSLIRTYTPGFVPVYHLTPGATLTYPDGWVDSVWSCISHNQHQACSELVQMVSAVLNNSNGDAQFMVLPDYKATVPATLIVKKRGAGDPPTLQTLYTIPVFVRQGMQGGTYTLELPAL